MSKSIIDNNKNKCYLCGHQTPNTKKYICIYSNEINKQIKAESEGLFVYLCTEHTFGKTLDEGCVKFVERDKSFKKMLIGIAEDKWKEVHKANHEDYVKEYGENQLWC